MNQKGKKIKLLLLTIPIYFMQGSLYPKGSIISQLCALIWIIVNIYYCIKSIRSKDLNVYSKSIILFVGIQCISWLISPKGVHSDGLIFMTYGELKNILLMMLSYFPFYYLVKKGELDIAYIRKYLLIVFVSFIAYYYMSWMDALSSQFWKDATTNNGGYLLPMILPMIAFFFNEKKAFGLIFITFVLVLFSAKRGAILCVTFEICMFLYYKYKSGGKMNKLKVAIALAAVIFCISYVAYYIYQQSDYLQLRLLDTLEGGTSGRDELKQMAIDVHLHGSLLEKMFGYGFYQFIDITGWYTHSDWYELLVDSGYFGIFLYALVFYNLLYIYIRNRQNMELPHSFLLTSVFLCWLIKSYVSMGYNAPEACMLNVLIGICLALDYRKKYVSTK